MADLKISQLTGATTPLAGTEVLPIVQSGSTRQVSVANLTAGRTQTSNGVVQGTAGTGYNFTANTPAAGMTSQLLNWYEEGTWTPTDGSGAGLTFTLARGVYVRVGRMVQIMGMVTYPTTANASPTQINGLPFNLAANYYVGMVPTQDTGQNYSLRIDQSNSYLTVRDNLQNQITNAQVSGKFFGFTLTYEV